MRFSDEWLRACEAGEHGHGYRNAAPALWPLTPEQRRHAMDDAWRLRNRVAMRFSQAVHDAAAAIREGGRLHIS